MNQPAETTRPAAITAICTIGFVGVALVIPLIFSSIALKIGNWYPPYLAFSSIAGFACLWGFWTMKKWGVYAYTVLVLANQVVLLSTGLWSLFSILIPAIVIGVGFTHLKKMT
ncbi:hypothetical protein [Emticicia agri]|uniref:Uncharacterized protein n=1 Tax=Emticicia agri TaxID=2492393 RepID=A0A4Q5M3P7_9BACT|nr:hypothetical protein [Emticicia agri]RYU96487.1 hypothetical protein EWM59_06645 [Emticicia agri]